MIQRSGEVVIGMLEYATSDYRAIDTDNDCIRESNLYR